MNLVEKLLAVDKEEFDKIEKKEIASRQLSRLTGEEDTKIIIQAIDGDLFGSLSGSGLHNNGDVDYEKLFSANAKIAAAGIVEPNLKDETLLKHIGVATPAEAAKNIFKGEVNKISDEISRLSGFLDEDETEKEVKN